MSKNSIKQFFIWFRNGMSFATTWFLLLLLIRNQLLGVETMQTDTLCKLLVSIAGGVLLFCVAFLPTMLKKWSFLKRLTLFMSIFSIYECICFYWMGVFCTMGGMIQYGIFAGLVLICYVLCLGINRAYGKKKGEVYNQALRKYQGK